MKKLFVISTILLLSGMIFPAYSQESGIYLNAEDFTISTLTHSIDCAKSNHKIIAPGKKPMVKVVHEGQKAKYKKSDIFGYRDCEGKDYRFFDGQNYQVNEVGALLIYQQGKSRAPIGEDVGAVAKFFFSKGPDEEVLPLTLMSLKEAFPENHPFHDALDAYFSGNTPVSTYDNFHKTYKVNRILEENLH
ncbi:MAG: hypothetical protein H6557_31800 [Lewinellaceae bacterium]|nr:hypothetical protein [Phaeodactylibacter sp.]MCB9041231.1 hypothetical protein [Lewinellaceae bacterium]